MEAYMIDYWKEALACALDDVDAFGLLTKEQIASVAKAMADAAETAGMANGRDAIPNPARAEEKRLNDVHAAEVKRLEAHLGVYTRTLAAKLGVDPRRIYIRNGEAMVDR